MQTVGLSWIDYYVWWLEHGMEIKEEIIMSEILWTEELPHARHPPTTSTRPSWWQVTNRRQQGEKWMKPNRRLGDKHHPPFCVASTAMVAAKQRRPAWAFLHG